MLAIALQGVGGMNLFASGVLDEFRDRGLKPDLISATSGSILSAFHFLYPHMGADKANNPFYTGYGPVSDYMNYINSIIWGKPGVFRPLTLWERYWKEFPIDNIGKITNMMFPAQLYISQIPQDFFETIAEGFRKSDTGIIINSYSLPDDNAVLYVNGAAMEKIATKLSYYDDLIVKEMSADGIIASLRLLQLGDYHGEYDGAYQYNPILYPLVIADHIIVVTVQSFKKAIKRSLDNYFDQEDFKLKMLFKNSLYAQLNEIELINKLVARNLLHSPLYKYVKVHIVQLTINQGYFDYFVENPAAQKDGRKQAQIFLDDFEDLQQYVTITK